MGGVMSEHVSIEEFRDIINGKAKPRNRSTNKVSKLEFTAGSKPMETRKDPWFDSPVSLAFTHYRHRECDVDNLSAKAAIDGLVAAGILRNDSPKEVVKVSHEQFKISKTQDERTVILITEV